MTREIKHTPGPWYLVGHNWHETSVYSDTTGQRVCSMDTQDWDVNEETQDEFESVQASNAHLIAAAPDMKGEILRNIQFLYELRGLFDVMKLNDTVHKVGLEMHIETQEKLLKKAAGEK